MHFYEYDFFQMASLRGVLMAWFHLTCIIAKVEFEFFPMSSNKSRCSSALCREKSIIRCIFVQVRCHHFQNSHILWGANKIRLSLICIFTRVNSLKVQLYLGFRLSEFQFCHFMVRFWWIYACRFRFMLIKQSFFQGRNESQIVSIFSEGPVILVYFSMHYLGVSWIHVTFFMHILRIFGVSFYRIYTYYAGRTKSASGTFSIFTKVFWRESLFHAGGLGSEILQIDILPRILKEMYQCECIKFD